MTIRRIIMPYVDTKESFAKGRQVYKGRWWGGKGERWIISFVYSRDTRANIIPGLTL